MTETRSVIVERDLAFPAERVWRALTQPHLISEWLMKTDFAPETGRRFEFIADWGSVACEVLEIEPQRRLSYSWVAMGVDSIVTFTLTPGPAGTRLRVEQAGFREDQQANIRGALAGWHGFLDRLAALVAGLD